MNEKKYRISLGKRLRNCPSYICFGVMPNWQDYPPEVREAIRGAEVINYPSALYEDLLQSLGKHVFPRNYYRFMGNKIRQTALFQLLGIPHPRTRLYYGRRSLERICRDFAFPFIAKTPVGSSQGCGVWLIQNNEDLSTYLESHCPAYIQEYLPIDRDLRFVLIKGKVIHSYWRIQKPGDFRNNVSQGAHISYDDIPQEAAEFAESVARRCRFDEVGLDICRVDQTYYVIEANMVFGLEGFRRVGMDLHEILIRMDRQGDL